MHLFLCLSHSFPFNRILHFMNNLYEDNIILQDNFSSKSIEM